MEYRAHYHPPPSPRVLLANPSLSFKAQDTPPPPGTRLPLGTCWSGGCSRKSPPFCMCLPNRPPSCCRTGTAPQCCSALGLTWGSLLSHPMAEHCARTTVPVDPAHGQAYPGNAGLCSPQSRERGKREVTGPWSPCWKRQEAQPGLGMLGSRALLTYLTLSSLEVCFGFKRNALRASYQVKLLLSFHLIKQRLRC